MEEQQHVRFVLQGRTPLLMHSPKAMQSSGPSVGRKNIPLPEVEAEQGAYRLPDGALCMPAEGVRNAILRGAVGMRNNRKALKPQLAGTLMMADPFFPLVDVEGKAITEYEIDTRRAIVQKQGVMRSRPMLPAWWLVCTFGINTGFFASDKVLQDVLMVVLIEAGRIVGIGDYRIEKNGWFGSFVPVEIEVI